MPTLTKTLADFQVKCTLDVFNLIVTAGTVTKSFSISGIPNGSTINTATLSGKVRAQMFGGVFKAANDSSVTLYSYSQAGNAEHSFSGKNVKTWLTALNGTYNTLSVEFSYKTEKNYVPRNSLGDFSYSQEYGYFSDITLTVDYSLPYTAVTAPTSVSLSVANTYPNQKTTLSWSGAKSGTNNAITGYEVWRSTTTNTSSAYSLLKGGISKSTTSYQITAPSTNETWYFKVKTIGTQSGLDSGLSSATATMSMTSTACGAPSTVSVSPTTPEPDATVTLTWSGAKAGTNNGINGYEIYRATSKSGTYSLVKTITSSSTSGSWNEDKAPQSGSRYYKIITKGAYINSGFSPIVSFTTTRTNTSTFTVPATFEIGTNPTITISDHTGNPHVLAWEITNGPSGSVDLPANTETYDLSMPLSRLDSMTTATSFTITYELTTNTSGGNKIGMVRKTGTTTVPDNIKPTVSNSTVIPVNLDNSHAVPDAWGNVYVEGHSLARITLSTAATVAYSAPIVSYKISGNGASATSSSLPITADSDGLYAGAKTFTVSATDTRGRTGTETLTVTVLPYSKPTLSGIVSLRTNDQAAYDDEGTYIYASAIASVASCGERNVATVTVKYKKESVSGYTTAGDLSGGHLLFGGGNITLQDSYDVQYIVKDSLNETRTYQDVVTRSVWELHIRKGGGAWAFGGVANSTGNLHIYGGLKLDTALAIADGGTGATSASAARTNLGLGDALTDIGNLQTALGGTKLIQKYCAKSDSLSFTFSGQCNFVIFTDGGVQALRSIIWGHCTSGGSVSANKTNAASSSQITLTTSVTNKLTIANDNTSYQLNVLFVAISGASNVS